MAIKININQDVTSRLKFEPRTDLGMFCVGKLESVEFDTKHIDEDKSWEFKGLDIPRLAFHFVNHDDPDGIQRFFSKSELPLSAVKTSGEISKEDKLATRITALWGRIKHIHDAYKGQPNYRPWTYEPSFSTAEEKPSPADRIAEYVAFFKAVHLAFVGDETKGEKPIWLDAAGNSIPMTMKLIATDGQKSQYLDFPQYVGEGFIQPYQLVDGKLKTTLKFKPNETTKLAATPSATPAGSGVPGEEGVDETVRKAILG